MFPLWFTIIYDVYIYNIHISYIYINIDDIIVVYNI